MQQELENNSLKKKAENLMNNSFKRAKDMKKHTYRRYRNMKYLAVEKCEDAVEKVKSGIEFV